MKENILEIDRATEPYTYITISSLVKMGKQIERLQEQLADANKTIDYYDKKDFHYTLADGTVMGAEPAHKYKIKWGVK